MVADAAVDDPDAMGGADAMAGDAAVDAPDAEVDERPDAMTPADGAVPPADGGIEPQEVPFQTGTEIVTASGEIQGREDDELRVFKGIPFAAPPVGERRFKAPAPVEPWGEPLVADEFGPSCLQAVALNDNGTSEDCLTLNVWAHQDDEPRPVMVWIYGGGFIVGETAMGTYDGADLAQSADVVVVSINYRLGVLGNLALPELRDEDPMGAVGNMGLLDQIEALRWVKANAAAFGGDPENITVFGESAGAISTCALMGAPLADDLFHKAIMQSGNCTLFSVIEGEGLPGVPGVFEFGEQIAAEVGCGEAEDRLACLREAPAEDLVDVLEAGALLNILDTGAPLGWTIDGVVLPQMPYDRIRAGEAPERPVIAGSNGNEGFIFTLGQDVPSREAFRDLLAPIFGGPEAAQQIVDLYPRAVYPLSKDAFTAFMGEWLFNCNGYHMVRSLDGLGYAYELRVGPPLLMTPYGPMHAADLFYVFGNFLRSLMLPTAVDLGLSRRVQLAWGSFARTGVPTWEGGWPPARAENPQHLSIEIFSEVRDEFRAGRCDAMREMGVLP